MKKYDNIYKLRYRFRHVVKNRKIHLIKLYILIQTHIINMGVFLNVFLNKKNFRIVIQFLLFIEPIMKIHPINLTKSIMNFHPINLTKSIMKIHPINLIKFIMKKMIIKYKIKPQKVLDLFVLNIRKVLLNINRIQALVVLNVRKISSFLKIIYKFIVVYNIYIKIIFLFIPLSLRICTITNFHSFWIASLLISEPSDQLSENDGNIQNPSFIQIISESLISEPSNITSEHKSVNDYTPEVVKSMAELLIDETSSFSDTSSESDTEEAPIVSSHILHQISTDLIVNAENDITQLRAKKVVTLVGLRDSINQTVVNAFDKIFPFFPQTDTQLNDLNHPFNKLLLNIKEIADNSTGVNKKIYWDLFTLVYAYGTAELENILPNSIMKSTQSFDQFQLILKDKYTSP